MVTAIAIKREEKEKRVVKGIARLHLLAGAHRPILENARRRLQEAISIFEKAKLAKPTDHTAFHMVEEQKRMSKGMLSMAALPNAIILLSEDPADPVAKKALGLVSEHGTCDEIRMAARILLEKR